MKPEINGTTFGSITIDGVVYNHDVIIRLSGKVKKRKKKLSKAVYGTSHIISQAEAEHVYEEGAVQVIVGTGQAGILTLSDEATHFFKKKKCRVTLLSTGKAVQAWNKTEGNVAGLFHVTC